MQIDRCVGIRRILADELHLREIAAGAREADRARTGCAREIRQRAFIVSDDSRIQAADLPRLAVIIPVHAEIQREIGTESSNRP